MGRASLIKQVEILEKKHEAFGESKFDLKQQGNWEEIGNKFFSFESAKTFLRASCTFVNFVKSQDTNVKFLRDIKPEHFEKYVEHIKEKGLSTRTIKGYSVQLEKLDHFIRDDFKGQGFINDNNRVVMEKNWKSGKTRSDRALSYDENSREKLQNALEKYSDTIKIVSYTGMRKESIDHLRVEHVHLDKQTITLIEKGGREREIPLRQEILNEIKSLVAGKNQDDRVFSVKSATLSSAIYRHNKENGLPMRSLHSLRHEYAQREYRERYKSHRENGELRIDADKKARSETSALLGHGKIGSEQGILDGKSDATGRVQVTYEYVDGKTASAIRDEVEAEL